MKKNNLLLLSLFSMALVACAGADVKYEYPEARRGKNPTTQKEQSIFGEDGLSLLGKGKKEDQTSGIGVNSFLWRATLDTVSFMPIASADPFGGVIITDWYSNPNTPSERFKLNIFILDKQLRADGLKVAVFKQVLDDFGNWKDANVDAKTPRDLEDTILTRARQLKLNSQNIKE